MHISSDSSDTDEEQLMVWRATSPGGREVTEIGPVDSDHSTPQGRGLGLYTSQTEHTENMRMLLGLSTPTKEGGQDGGYNSADDPDWVPSSESESDSVLSEGSLSEGSLSDSDYKNEILHGVDGYLSCEDPDWVPVPSGLEMSDELSGEEEPSDAEDLCDNELNDSVCGGDSEYDSEDDSEGSLKDFICNDDELECEDDYDPEQDHLNWGNDHDKNFKRLKHNCEADSRTKRDSK